MKIKYTDYFLVRLVNPNLVDFHGKSPVTDLDKDRENNFRDVEEDQFDFEFFDLCLEFTCFQIFPELSFEDGEYGFDLVSLMVAGLVERPYEFPSEGTEDAFPFSGSDRDKRIGVQVISDQSVNIFRIVSFIEDVDIRFSRSVTLNEEIFCMRDVVNRLLRILNPVTIWRSVSTEIEVFRNRFRVFPVLQE